MGPNELKNSFSVDLDSWNTQIGETAMTRRTPLMALLTVLLVAAIAGILHIWPTQAKAQTEVPFTALPQICIPYTTCGIQPAENMPLQVRLVKSDVPLEQVLPVYQVVTAPTTPFSVTIDLNGNGQLDDAITQNLVALNETPLTLNTLITVFPSGPFSFWVKVGKAANFTFEFRYVPDLTPAALSANTQPTTGATAQPTTAEANTAQTTPAATVATSAPTTAGQAGADTPTTANTVATAATSSTTVQATSLITLTANIPGDTNLQLECSADPNQIRCRNPQGQEATFQNSWKLSNSFMLICTRGGEEVGKVWLCVVQRGQQFPTASPLPPTNTTAPTQTNTRVSLNEVTTTATSAATTTTTPTPATGGFKLGKLDPNSPVVIAVLCLIALILVIAIIVVLLLRRRRRTTPPTP